MTSIVLNNQTTSGDKLEATFLPEKGMNLISFKRGSIEVIDQSTQNLFEERFAGLGALIGPHFHHRNSAMLPIIKDESLFPHIARVKAKGIKEPFSHGIGRYAPWQAQSTNTKVSASLSGKDLWNGVPLAELEGQNFKMSFSAELSSEGLQLELSVVSDTDSLVGIHYYYHLPNGHGTVISHIQPRYIDEGELKPLPIDFNIDAQQRCQLSLDKSFDATFYPFPNPLQGSILLDAGTHQVLTNYACTSQENCWQLYHPEGASFVCIEPISAQDPRHANLTVSSISIQLQILHSSERRYAESK